MSDRYLIYLYRYTIELFFRVFKQLLGLRHLISQRPNGIDIQVYCTAIVCLLLCLITGKKPDKSNRNMIGWYLIGLASQKELLNHLDKPDNTGIMKKAKEGAFGKNSASDLSESPATVDSPLMLRGGFDRRCSSNT